MKGQKSLNRKHCAAPPRVSPIRHPNRVALPENAHPQLVCFRQSQPFCIIIYAARIKGFFVKTFLGAFCYLGKFIFLKPA
jgi:hypothetical protein